MAKAFCPLIAPTEMKALWVVAVPTKEVFLPVAVRLTVVAIKLCPKVRRVAVALRLAVKVARAMALVLRLAVVVMLAV